MCSSDLSAAAQAVKATRLVGRSGRIGALPFPASMWTVSRDIPAPPAENFRDWWRRTHGPGAAGSTASGAAPGAGTGAPTATPTGARGATATTRTKKED